MDPAPSSKPKRSIRSFLRQKVGNTSRGLLSPSALGPSSRAPSGQSSPLNPSPIDLLGSAARIASAPAPANQVADAQHASVRVLLQAPGDDDPSTLASRNEPPTIAASARAADRPNSDENSVNPTTLIDPASQAGQRTTSRVWARLATALRALHNNARPLPPLQSAIGNFIPCLDALEAATRNHREYEQLASELSSVAELLAEHMKQSSSTRMSGSIANIAHAIEEQAKLIETQQARGTGRRLMEASMDEDELGWYYHRIGSLFRQLQADANLSIWNIVNNQMANTQLERLKPVILANYDSTLSEGINRRTCTPNTRTAILLGLNEWSRKSNVADLYWMNGMAGTGKTTIACSFCESLEERKQLAASFFCTRTVPECREVTRIIPTIAYQLARYSVPFQSVLCEALGEDPDIGAKSMTKQFERLLRAPLLKVAEAIPKDLVVVIDALDECSNMREAELLLSILLKSVVELPLKFFVTSRPEPEIYGRMLVKGQGAGDVLHLHDVEKSLVQADIEVYLSEELDFLSPTPAQITELAQRSGSLFIYAATLVRYIRPGRRPVDPHSRLQSALAITSQHNKMHAEIDELYTTVLKVALDTEGLEDREIDDLQRVLWTTVCIQEPVGIDIIAAMTGLSDTQRVETILDSLRSVIHFSEASGLVSTLHASFPDFLFDEARSKSFTCNLVMHSESLTQKCFRIMKDQLRFNICKLESSFIPDSEVSDMEERVKQAISPPLWYACHYWGDHMRRSIHSDLLHTMLSEFLSDRLLFWMEVLNLKREIRMGAVILLKAKLWLKVNVAFDGVARLIEDARNFVTSFAANPVSQCTPHIYISSLPFCPRSSSVFKQYWKKMRGVINVAGSAIQRRETAPLASWNAGSQVRSVVYSPDSGCIAAGCQDGTVRVRSAYDGTPLLDPFQGHTNSVQSVAYSPDGSRIVSGSWDCTIRVWSSHDGALFAGPFQGHAEPVYSVAYSPDGTRIVSGSGDKTIRVWSAHDGSLLGGPLQGHTDLVWSVAYSPDGSRIVSGSWDCTIRVWSAHDGTPLVGPFKGHTESVYSVAYSPDGTRIVSGSGDNTIRVWNACHGKPISSPFQGHTADVRSVSYSSDGQRIVSGSRDTTIRVWCAHDGALLAGPFQGHTNAISSAAYSPDGIRIVSGSMDETIRVWSAYNGELIAGPFQKPTVDVCSVAYSPDGSRIASGSWDDAIRVWNAHDGAPIAAFQEHTDPIWSIAWSPSGSFIVSGSKDNAIQLWNAHNGKHLASPFHGHSNLVLSVAYSPDGTRIVSGSMDETIRVWSSYDGKPLSGPFEGHTGSVSSVAYSPDGTRIVSGSWDKSVRVWSAHDGAPLVGPFQGHMGSVSSVAYSPDGSRIISGSLDRTIRVWCAHDGALLAGPFQGHTGSVLSVAYSPDGTRVISGSSDRTIRLWRERDGELLVDPFQGHTGPVWSVAYSPDSMRIVSASSDGTIRVWSAQDSALVADTSEGRIDSIGDPTTAITMNQAPNTTTPYRVCRVNSALTHWVIRHDGWVIDSSSQLLFWVPFELASYLPASHELLVIYPHGLFQIHHNDAFLGELWCRCYEPE